MIFVVNEGSFSEVKAALSINERVKLKTIEACKNDFIRYKNEIKKNRGSEYTYYLFNRIKIICRLK